ncbi:protein FAM32A-like isoform X2 [Lepeophtheirus salmonis]|uniref:protein FAM32A-like isoform X2 n=1 Tax=Lepeophtheirus salmonis TaxID=72036 RepID=UPI001AEA49E1|nr:protein FAM32A-like isoform X3 [Lepeophtheirus salmonis]
MSEYSMVNTSSLKLKGVSDSGKIKKKSKKKKKSKDLQPSSSKGDIEPQDPQEGETDEVPSTSYYKGKTKSELQFLKRKEKLDFGRIKKKASVSHKERVEKFNEYLNNLSEHYEPAKVSWTK